MFLNSMNTDAHFKYNEQSCEMANKSNIMNS